LIIAAGIVLLSYLKPITKSAGPISWFAGAVGMVAYIILRIAFPQRLTIDPRDEFVSFEFRDPGLAVEFQQLNRGI
jgi:hypothetical protein